MPLDFINPQLATAVDHPPPRAGWIHEVKHDGYRTLLIIERHKASAFTRNGFDWTERYPSLTRQQPSLAAVPPSSMAKSLFRMNRASRILKSSNQPSGGAHKP